MTKTKTMPKSKSQTKANGLPDVLTLEEAAEYLRVSPKVVKDLVAGGAIPARDIGSELRFLKAALADWLRTFNSRAAMTAQIGAFADDQTMPELRRKIYEGRGRPEVPEREDV
jgi:excisionase family DNA binding protein